MHRLHRCRACLRPQPYLFLPLGEQPPASMLVRQAELGEVQPCFSLDAHVCLGCGLIEIPDQVPRDFFRHHLRIAPMPQETTKQKRALAKLLHDIAGDDLVVTIRGEDGSLLDGGGALASGAMATWKSRDRTDGAGTWLELSCGSFDSAAASQLRAEHGAAKVIVARDCLHGIGDLHRFMEGITRLLEQDGTLLVETAWSREALRRNAFDAISAEHLSLFSLLSLVELCAHFGMAVTDVQRLPDHGGSIRAFIRNEQGAVATPAVRAMLEEEITAGILKSETYDAFAARVGAIRDGVLTLLWELKAQGLRVAGYGAPESGNTLLNFCGIGRLELDFLADADPRKHEMYSPGMKIPIRSLDAIVTERPDILLVLDDELMRQPPNGNSGLTPHGARLLVPLPHPHLIS